MQCVQVSANQGPDSTFAVEANIKSLGPKSNRGSILKSQNRVHTKHEYQPGSKMDKQINGAITRPHTKHKLQKPNFVFVLRILFKANYYTRFALVFNHEYYANLEFFPNTDTMAKYSPKFAEYQTCRLFWATLKITRIFLVQKWGQELNNILLFVGLLNDLAGIFLVKWLSVVQTISFGLWPNH